MTEIFAEYFLQLFFLFFAVVNSAVKKSVLVLLARHKCVILLVEFVDQFVFQERKPRTRY